MKKAKACTFVTIVNDPEFWDKTKQLYNVTKPYAVATGKYCIFYLWFVVYICNLYLTPSLCRNFRNGNSYPWHDNAYMGVAVHTSPEVWHANRGGAGCNEGEDEETYEVIC